MTSNQSHPGLPEIPGCERDAHGKPRIGLDEASLYAYAHLLRLTEQLILDLFSRGLLSGTTHTCLGQELCQIAVVRAMSESDDVVLSNHRNHGHFMTYSGHFVGLVAEVMGREREVPAVGHRRVLKHREDLGLQQFGIEEEEDRS